jgi:hypothetical protein
MTDELTIHMPPFPTPAKPLKASPCNGCGWCCHSEVCRIGQHFFGEETPAPCPAIVYEDGRVKCGIVMAEREILKTDHFAEMLGIGKGCCADEPNEVNNA